MDIEKRIDVCNKSGGLKKLYVLKFEKYSRSQANTTNNIITTFPYNVIYELDFVSGGYSENVNPEDGGLVVKKSLNFKLKDIQSTDSVISLVKADVRFIFITKDDKIRMVGYKTGLTGSYTANEGVNRQDFKGYDLTFETTEETQAPFLTNLDFFDIDADFLLQENGFLLLLENGFKIKI